MPLAPQYWISQADRLRTEDVPAVLNGFLTERADRLAEMLHGGDEKANYPIAWMCRQLGVPRSSFYAWRAQTEHVTATTAHRRVLAELVVEVFDDSRGTYGCRRVAAELNRSGHPVSVGLVAELMRELGLAACQPRAYKVTTLPGEQPVASPDLIEREFTADQPGQRLVGDITYLRTGEGWLYLATVIDLATRMVVGWQLAEHMRTSLVTDALTMAITGGHAPPGVIFHSDKGCQYTSTEFARFCTGNQIRASVGPTGVCWDNAAAESFFATLKNEMYYRQRFDTPGESTVCGRGIHRNLLQPQTATLQPGLPHPSRSPHQPPGPSSSLTTTTTRNCPRSLTQPRPR